MGVLSHMNIFYNFIFYIWTFMNFVTTCFFLYQICIGIAGLFTRKQSDAPYKNHRFAAVIAARNEENIIEYLIESLKMQNYPSDILDIIVVADNCDDNTAEVAEKAGAIVFKRFNKTEIGKGYVLRFAFDKIFELHDFYDAFCIFDADNIVDSNFIHNMNKELCSGIKVAQGYRDMKNAQDTWISGGHALFYWFQNRFYNASRSFLGLSANINGTGWMVSADVIKEHGYDMTTLTEDLEFSMNCILNDYKIGWVPDAIVYDEQPVTLKQSVTQRIRWTSGYMQAFTKYVGKYFKKLLNKPDWPTCDMFMFILFFPVFIVGIASGLLYAVLAAFRVVDTIGFLINTLLLASGAAVGIWILAIATIYLEKKDLKKLKKAVLAYPIFNLTWIAIYFMCFFKRSTEWKPITHVRNMSIREVEATKAKPF
jgi:cellulose synthase/poly-beta-1,6-N-acetylglucosamine synthase-like glycosyltransferase